MLHEVLIGNDSNFMTWSYDSYVKVTFPSMIQDLYHRRHTRVPGTRNDRCLWSQPGGGLVGLGHFHLRVVGRRRVKFLGTWTETRRNRQVRHPLRAPIPCRPLGCLETGDLGLKCPNIFRRFFKMKWPRKTMAGVEKVTFPSKAKVFHPCLVEGFEPLARWVLLRNVWFRRLGWMLSGSSNYKKCSCWSFFL